MFIWESNKCRDGDKMHLLKSKIFSPKKFKDIDEPMIYKDSAVFIQRSKKGSKIAAFNACDGKIKSILLKGLYCFNAHNEDSRMAFEYAGSSRGMGVLYLDEFTLKGIPDIKPGAALGGIWKNSAVLRCGDYIMLHDISGGGEEIVSYCPNMIGLPSSGYDICAWIQIFKGEHCINLCSLKDRDKLIFVPYGRVISMHMQDGYIVYHCLKGNTNNIFTYGINSGKLVQLCSSEDWIELYPGRNGTIAWTVRKSMKGRYTFDLWVYNIKERISHEIVSGCKNAIIPSASGDLVIWAESCSNGDNLYSANIK